MQGRNRMPIPDTRNINVIRVDRSENLPNLSEFMKNFSRNAGNMRYAEIFGNEISDAAIHVKDAPEMGVIERATGVLIFDEDDATQAEVLNMFLRVD